MPKVKIDYTKITPNPPLNFRNSWKLSIRTVQGSHYIFTYNIKTQLVSAHTLDSDGNKQLELEDLPIDRFQKLYDRLTITEREFI